MILVEPMLSVSRKITLPTVDVILDSKVTHSWDVLPLAAELILNAHWIRLVTTGIVSTHVWSITLVAAMPIVSLASIWPNVDVDLDTPVTHLSPVSPSNPLNVCRTKIVPLIKFVSTKNVSIPALN